MNDKLKVAWITGASSGIGEALALCFLREGYRIIISARRGEVLEELANRFQDKRSDILVLPFDLTEHEVHESICQEAGKAFGGISVMVHCGGVSQRSTVAETLPEVSRRIMEINFFSCISLTRYVLAQMNKQGYGSFIVISSLSGKFGFYLRSAYAASKHALHGYFESLYLENHNRNIHVLMVCPGFIQTSISAHALTGTGSPYAQEDDAQRKGMSAQTCADKIFSAHINGKREVIIGGRETWPVWIKRFFPGLFWQIMFKRDPRKEQ